MQRYFELLSTTWADIFAEERWKVTKWDNIGWSFKKSILQLDARFRTQGRQSSTVTHDSRFDIFTYVHFENWNALVFDQWLFFFCNFGCDDLQKTKHTKFSSYTGKRHTPIHLSESHSGASSSRKTEVSRVLSTFGHPIFWKKWADHVSGRPGVQETEAISDGEFVATKLSSSEFQKKKKKIETKTYQQSFGFLFPSRTCCV